MMNPPSGPEPRNIPLDLFLTLLTCGFWNLVVQKSQFEYLNRELKEEKYSLTQTVLWTLLTCGIYMLVIEYRKARDWERISGQSGDTDAILALTLGFLGLTFVFDAILQDKINRRIDQEHTFKP
jgi:hypothetical protein